MESPIIVRMILLKTAMALLLVSSPVAAQEIELVKEVCGKTSVRYDDCTEALYDFQTVTTKDLRALTMLTLNLAMANSSEAMGFVSGMVENSPPAMKPVLDSCFGFLYGSYFSFHSAILDINMGGKSTAASLITNALAGPADCRTAMELAKVSIPAVQTRCNNVEFFGKISYTATSMLTKTGS
ncbi:uncharacterized protein LOC116189388 [Punica granatum]|uniref:Pectinesterase inhibitor domain-containing protein n=2 Tax=Punica granatum TaxID=22663 RepID=A0A218X578_PUNGR|nr:uncharacterized protein LOC116189388 [Punica granatum]OWM80073.1 hypothetical protein CDL15_Pgr010051 [Punica granatum]PKI70281.1 hypothetical protein CRG98_009310 [Punica granatum]